MAVKVIIDGKEVEAKEGQTVLEVIREHRLGFIPTLCHSPKLKPIGACSLCVVEIEGMKGLPLACTTVVRDGMKVTAHNERLENIRQTAIDLLLSTHNADCLGPCRLGCPAGVDVQAYLALAKMGEFKRALNLIREKNPFPASVGRVCVRYCEDACRRAEVDEAVSINLVKRYIADNALDTTPFPPVPPLKTDKRVAIIGGGPGGLAAAHYLRREGVPSTIFEAFDKLGGMMRYGIPDYRLPQEILDKEINYILEQGGIEVKTGVRLGKDFTLSDLKNQGYAAVFLAMGAMGSRRLKIPGEDLQGVEPALNFLIKVKQEGLPRLSGKVVVLGGGNTAIDVARTALRAGAESVHVLYRRTEKEMPADPYEVEEAREEGVVFEFLQSPVEIIGENGHVKAVKMQRMKLGEPDASGRRRPIPIEGSEFIVEADWVFSAIGQVTDILDAIDDGNVKVPLTRWNTIATIDNYGRTAIDWIFAGGDVVLGPAAVIDAIGQGRRAALAMAEYVLNKKVINRFKVDQENLFLSTKDTFGKLPDYEKDAIEKVDRNWYPARPATERARSYELEVLTTPTKVQADTESNRCLFCGCADFDECELRFLADVYKLPRPKFVGDAPRKPIDKRVPFFELDPNKCVLCMRCVRYCDEYMHVDALAFKDRGFDTTVVFQAPDFDASVCTGCGNCTEICPTGAILQKDDFGIITPIAHDTKASVCTLCGDACEVAVHQYTDKMVQVRSRRKGLGDFTDLCGIGRYGNGVLTKNRLTKPMVKKDGKLVEVDWDEAVNAAAKLMEKGNVHGFVSPWATNEQILAFSQLIHGIEGKLSSRYERSTGVGPYWTTGLADYSEIEQADLILLLNPAAVMKQDVLWHRIIRARYDNKANLVMMAPWNFAGAKHATSLIQVGVRNQGKVLAAALKQLGKEADFAELAQLFDDSELQPFDGFGKELAGMIKDAKHALLVFGADNVGVMERDLWMASALIDRKIIVREAFNANGMWILGTLDGDAEIKEDSVVVLLRDNPSADYEALDALKNAGGVVVFDTHESPLLDYADVVLPVELPMEVGGSFVNGEGKLVKFSAGMGSWVKQSFIDTVNAIAGKLSIEIGDIEASINGMIQDWTGKKRLIEKTREAQEVLMLDTYHFLAKNHFLSRSKDLPKDMVTW